jgi:hypothetical protein
MAPQITPDFVTLIVNMIFGILLMMIFPIFWFLDGLTPFFMPYYELSVSGCDTSLAGLIPDASQYMNIPWYLTYYGMCSVSEGGQCPGDGICTLPNGGYCVNYVQNSDAQSFWAYLDSLITGNSYVNFVNGAFSMMVVGKLVVVGTVTTRVF